MRWPFGGPRHAPPADESLRGVEDLLARYAARDLSPTPDQWRRPRAASLQVVAARAAARPTRHGFRVTSRRLTFVLGVTALLSVAATAAAAESGPGQPFYEIRLKIETLGVPAAGAARTDALFAQLDRRLDEATAQSGQRNALGVADAVRAYRATLSEMRAGIGPDVSRIAIEAGLERHVSVLQKILGSTPQDAQGGVRTALDQAEQAARALSQGGAGGSSQPAHPVPPSVPPNAPAGRP